MSERERVEITDPKDKDEFVNRAIEGIEDEDRWTDDEPPREGDYDPSWDSPEGNENGQDDS